MSEERKHNIDRNDHPRRIEKFDLELPLSQLLTRSTDAEFLIPNWDEYRWPNFEHPSQLVSYSSSDLGGEAFPLGNRRLGSARSKDELTKLVIALTLAALELAEAELIEMLNDAYLDATTEIVTD
jgi:hypothetical protein